MEQRWAHAAGIAAILCLGATPAQAQTRPDAGTLQDQQRLIPTLPAPGGQRLQIAPPSPPPPSAASVRITPGGFRFEGNTLVPTETLQGLVANRVGKSTDLAGLQQAARDVQAYYQDLGYLLTHAYVPEQTLAQQGGIVTIAVVEARIGKVDVQVEGDAAVHAAAIVASNLGAGDHVKEDALDRPVLLLRDLPGHAATATVQPGVKPGEVDVRVAVRNQQRVIETSAGLDNHGVRPAGRMRAFATLDVLNPSGNGDAISAKAQLAERGGNRLFRLGYAMPVGLQGTRASLSLARVEYALGEPFEALGAEGVADMVGASMVHPFVRSRNRNLYGLAAVEHKSLQDELTAVASLSKQTIRLLRLGLLGNAAWEPGPGTAFTSYAATVAAGHLGMDAVSQAADSGPGGLGAYGGFAKANLELQHTHGLGGPWSFHISAQGQWAASNLASAEKMTLGGPNGVRAYPAGEAAGDSGHLLTTELRYQFSGRLGEQAVPVTLAVFHDTGRVRLSQHPPAGTGRNHRWLAAAGLSLQAGQPGEWLAAAALAWRVGSEVPSGGEPDRSPRLWLTIQRWF